MRELDLPLTSRGPMAALSIDGPIAVVGNGRLGRPLAGALTAAGLATVGPYGRGYDGSGAAAVVLCVPDAEIARAASVIAPGRLVGHTSGATGLAPLAPHEAFSLHPLMTFTAAGGQFAGAGAAIAGSSARAHRFARALATALGMHPFDVAEQDRAAYHAAASMASNFLVTLEAAAERLAAGAGAERHLLVPLVRATVENWASLGGEPALTGPVVRGDEATVARQRQAVASRTPELAALFDALVDATRVLAGAAAPADVDAREAA